MEIAEVPGFCEKWWELPPGLCLVQREECRGQALHTVGPAPRLASDPWAPPHPCSVPVASEQEEGEREEYTST